MRIAALLEFILEYWLFANIGENLRPDLRT